MGGEFRREFRQSLGPDYVATVPTESVPSYMLLLNGSDSELMKFLPNSGPIPELVGI